MKIFILTRDSLKNIYNNPEKINCNFLYLIIVIYAKKNKFLIHFFIYGKVMPC